MFTIPVIFLILVKFGIIKTTLIAKNRLYFYFGLFVVTAIITPDGGPLADAALFFPMLALFEAALQIGKRYEKTPQNMRMREAPAKTEVICKFCGQELKDAETFCPKCGRSQI